MTTFDIASALVVLAALVGYLNHRFLRLPATIGVLALTLVGGVLLSGLSWLIPELHAGDRLAAFLSYIDFDKLLLRGMLGLLLFAGALHVGVQELLENRSTITALATVGVAISTALIGAVGWFVFHLMGFGIPLAACFVFGAIISPTDPVAVIGMLKRLRAPKDLEAMIAGESLFNDGVGVVAFLALASFSGMNGPSGQSSEQMNGAWAAWVLLRQAGGGALLGWIVGHAGCRVLRSVDQRELELLITIAAAMGVYSVSFPIGVSGPIAVVMTGLIIGTYGRQTAMSQRTVEHIDTFWAMVDDILNALLFLLIGMEVFSAALTRQTLVVAFAMIPIALGARFISVVIPVVILRKWNRYPKGLVPILTWGGLRGGLSVAMALSLPHGAIRDSFIGGTFGIVVFSILVQGLTMQRALKRFGDFPDTVGRIP